MMRQLSYPGPELPPILRDQIVSFLVLAWPKGFLEAAQKQTWRLLQQNHPRHFVLVEDSLLISHALVVWKYLDHAGQTYKTYGLSSVFTHPAFREQGYGGQVVAAGTACIQNSDADLAMLWCAPSLKNFYARYGWQGMENAQTWVGSPKAPTVYGLLLMMLFLSQKGRAGQAAFGIEPIYFGEEVW